MDWKHLLEVPFRLICDRWWVGGSGAKACILTHPTIDSQAENYKDRLLFGFGDFVGWVKTSFSEFVTHHGLDASSRSAFSFHLRQMVGRR